MQILRVYPYEIQASEKPPILQFNLEIALIFPSENSQL